MRSLPIITVKLAFRDRGLADAFNRSVAKVLGRKVNALTVTRNHGKVYYESKYSSRPLGLFLKGSLGGLRPFAQDYPTEFLRGLFSGDGCMSVSVRSFGLLVAIILSNSRLELLSLAEELLRTRFYIHSKIYRAKRRGTTWQFGGKTVVLRKDSYNLWVSRRQEVKAFVDRIGFVIKRKQRMGERAYSLIESVGRSRAGQVWKLTVLH